MRRYVSQSIIIILLIPLVVACSRPVSPALFFARTPEVTITSLPSVTGPRLAPVQSTQSTPAPGKIDTGPLWVTNPADRTVLRIDPVNNSVAVTIPVDGQPDTAVSGEGAVWVLDRAHSLVFRIDPSANRVTASIHLPSGNAQALAVGDGSVWVGMTGRIDLNNQLPGQEEEVTPPGMVVQIDPRENKFTGQYSVQPVDRLLIEGSALWVLSRTAIDTPLQVLDLSAKQGLAVPIRNSPSWLPVDALAVDPSNLWLFSTAYGKIFHGTPDGTIHSVVDLGLKQPTGYADLLLDTTGLWAATPWGSVVQIDPRTNHVDAAIDLSVPLSGLFSGGGAVWALSQQTGALFRIDPASHAVAAQISTGSQIQPTVVPTPTTRVVIWKPCKDAPTSRLKVGDLAYVTKDPPLPNRVRKDANRQGDILGYINPGGSMEILEGPTCADGWVWWKVKNADLTGWMAEGDKETYWMVPLYK